LAEHAPLSPVSVPAPAPAAGQIEASEPSALRGTLVRTLILALCLVAGGAFALRWWLHARLRVKTDNAFVEGRVAYVSPRVAGNVSQVLVNDNQHVRTGDVLVRLDPADFEASVARLRAEVEEARNRIAEARATIEALEAERKVAEVELLRARQEADRVAALLRTGVASSKENERAVAERDGAVSRIRALERRAAAAQALIGNEASVRSAEAALHQAELDLAYATVVAPFDGVVGRRSVEVGENVAKGRPLMAIASDEQTWVVANFKETQIREMKVGDAAEIRVDAFPDYTWYGRVESIAPATGATFALIPPDNASGNFTKVVQRVPVKIAVERRDPPVDESHGDAGHSLSSDHLPVGLSVEASVVVR
jgi:membrane fusion protein (multidrug efflux system)